jgi:Sulfotransferase domain
LTTKSKPVAKTTHFFIGPGRTGTTYLYNSLSNCPNVLCPIIKEPFFFDSNYHKGIDWYDSLYRLIDVNNKAPNESTTEPKYRVDFSNLYYLNLEAIKRILEYNDQANLIIIKRNHKELFRSMLYFELRKGKSIKSIKERADQIYNNSDCQSHIIKIKNIVGERLNVIDFSLITQENLIEISKQCKMTLQTSNQSVAKNARIIPKAQIFGLATKSTAVLLRRTGQYRLLQWLKNRDSLKSILFITNRALTRNTQIEKIVSDKFDE